MNGYITYYCFVVALLTVLAVKFWPEIEMVIDAYYALMGGL